MTIRMLIDARHREETRVAVVNGTRIEEFDFESAERKQLKGNIYLAKVTRVEPSLQAAFVDYGGNRHGFLAFSEIHPDYYQIPKEDRDALLREEAEHAAEEEALRAREEEEEEDAAEGESDLDAAGELDEHADDHDAEGEDRPAPRPTSTGGDDNAVEKLRERRMNLRRRYKIQDVIRRRQVLLVQVVKEERGNKGAALTTYLSLAGRYCVLMPNTSHGGGISRKISNASDRKRLKAIMAELNLPRSMGCIVRTAGLQRTKTEIKRDFDYLARLWDEIREKTLHSSAPALIYGDSDLIKRAIRDIYNRDIEEVIVEGDEGYRAARNFMKLLMPSHVKKVKQYIDRVPLFQRGRVEEQLHAMYQPVVQLKSGGYLVINPTEALVSIDINSGRSTREHNIEQTALSTNLEAAEEIARQLRLRDMAGLIVVDFIDMESNGNNRKVEKAMKAALANDRARIQVGRISSFGLFEMSRQRLRTGVLEASTRQCPHCEGSGLVRTASSAGLQALRLLEDEAARGRGSQLLLRASQEAAFYVLNRKRDELGEIEERYGVAIEVMPDGAAEGARMTIEAAGPPPVARAPVPLPAPEPEIDEDEILDEIEEEEEEEIEETAAEAREERGGEERGEGGRRKRRRRRRRGGRREEGEGAQPGEVAEGDEVEEPEGAEIESADSEEVEAVDAAAGGEEGEGRRRRNRRGRRGGRRRNGEGGTELESAEEQGDAEPLAEANPQLVADEAEQATPEAPVTEAAAAEEAAPVAEDVPAPVELAKEPAPRTRRRPRAAAAAAAAEGEPAADAEETPKPRRRRTAAATAAPAEGEEAPKPRRRSRKAAEPAAEVSEAEPIATEAAAASAEPVVAEGAPVPDAPEPVVAEGAPVPDAQSNDEPVADDTADEDAPSPRRGWWQRTFGG